MDWKSVECAAIKIREERCKQTLQSLLGGSLDHQPKVGLCLSGGGWRAMSSACALFDALSTPLEPSETHSGTEGIKLFDTVSYACGLSGGSWSLFTTLAGGYRNPFHSSGLQDGQTVAANGSLDNTASSMQTIGDESNKENHPWVYGRANAFDPTKHQYEGLKAMVGRDVVGRACYRGTAQKRFVSVTSKVGADTSFGAALATKTLGETLVGRWANFLANDILHFIDCGAKLSDTVGSPLDVPEDNPTNEPFSDVSDAERAKMAKVLAARDPNLNNPSRDIKLGDLKALIEAGDFPFVVCSAIANRDKTKGGRLYDWVEFSPFFLRNSAQDKFTTDVDNAKGYFAPIEKETGESRPLRVHHYMAICGSAFACDVSAVLPSSVSKTLQKHVEITNDPIIGRGVTEVVLADNSNFGICRDAGIDFNVPLPPMLSEHNREFDIIVVMDAGASSVNAFELWKAVDLGYLELVTPPESALVKFPKGNHVRLFRGLKGHPSIIYLLGLTSRPTSQIVYKPKDIIADVDEARNIALHELVPVLVSELRIAKARLEGRQTSAEIEAKAVTFKKSAVSMATRLSSQEADDEAEPSPNEPSNAAFDAIKGFSMNDVASSIVLNAAANNRLHDTIDSFLYVERAVLSSMPAARRIAVLKVLETHAVNSTFGFPQDSLKDDLTAISPEVLGMLLELGIVTKEPKPSMFGSAAVQSVSQRSSSTYEAAGGGAGSFINTSFLKGGDDRMQVDDSWIDYFAVMALVPNFASRIDQRTPILEDVGRLDTEQVCVGERWEKVRFVYVDRPWGRFSLLLGSLLARVFRSSHVDLSAYVSEFAAIRLRDHFILASTAFQAIAAEHEFTRMTWTQRDEHEEHLTLYARHLADMFAEALSPFARKHAKPFDEKLLVAFQGLLTVVLESPWDPSAPQAAIMPINQVLLIAEVFICHPNDNLLYLVRSLFVRVVGSSGGVAGLVARLADGTAASQHSSFDVQRLLGATFRLSDLSKRNEILAYFSEVGVFVPTYQEALRGCLGPLVKHMLENRFPDARMDSIDDVRTVLGATHHNALCLDGRFKRETILMLWTYGCSSLQFQPLLGRECMSMGFYWPFLSSCARVVRLNNDLVNSTVAARPNNLPGYDHSTAKDGESEVVVARRVLVERVVQFAESCRKSTAPVKVEFDSTIAADGKLLTHAQRERIDRVNSQIAHVAHRVAETAAAVGGRLVEKGLGVKSAAVGLVGGFFSKKKKDA